MLDIATIKDVGINLLSQIDRDQKCFGSLSKDKGRQNK